MRYAIVDVEGNTPLLEAAQPITRAQRLNALATLQRRIASGTLVLTAVTCATRSPIFMGKVSQLLHRYVEAHSADDLIFDFLGTSRDEFYATLLSFIAQNYSENVGRRFAAELAQKVLAGEIVFQDQNLSRSIADVVQARQELHAFCHALQSELLAKNDAPTDTPDQIFAAIEKGDLFIDEQDHTKLKAKFAAQNATFQTLINNCAQRQIILGYLELARDNSTISIENSSILLFCEITRIPVLLWTRADNSLTLELYAQQNIGADKRPIRSLVRVAGTTSYKFLVPADELPIDPGSPTAFQIEKIFNCQDTNAYKDNLLHRAVRGIAADILVPYLLNTVGFRNKINDLNKFNKNALHRAIRYFGEFRDKLQKELAGTADFYQVCLSVFADLVKAGTNLHVKDNEGASCLQRADFYQPQYQFQPNFVLSTWLQSQVPGAPPLPAQTAIKPTAPVTAPFFRKPAPRPPVEQPAAKKKKAAAKQVSPPSPVIAATAKQASQPSPVAAVLVKPPATPNDDIDYGFLDSLINSPNL